MFIYLEIKTLKNWCMWLLKLGKFRVGWQAKDPGKWWFEFQSCLPSFLGRSVSFLVKDSTEWMGPTHTLEGNLLYSMSADLNLTLIWKTSHLKNKTKYLLVFTHKMDWLSKAIMLSHWWWADYWKWSTGMNLAWTQWWTHTGLSCGHQSVVLCAQIWAAYISGHHTHWKNNRGSNKSAVQSVTISECYRQSSGQANGTRRAYRRQEPSR